MEKIEPDFLGIPFCQYLHLYIKITFHVNHDLLMISIVLDFNLFNFDLSSCIFIEFLSELLKNF